MWGFHCGCVGRLRCASGTRLGARCIISGERQDQVYWGTFNAIQHFGTQPDKDSEQKAKAALDQAQVRGLSKIRQDILQNYFQDLERCYQGDRDSCKKANRDMNEAIRAPR